VLGYGLARAPPATLDGGVKFANGTPPYIPDCGFGLGGVGSSAKVGFGFGGVDPLPPLPHATTALAVATIEIILNNAFLISIFL
jgi:hypothetical protein